MRRERVAPVVVEIPQRIFDDIFRYAERNFIPFGSVEWDCYNSDSDVDFLASMSEWDKAKDKWFSNESKFQLISYDQATFQSIKLKRKDDDRTRILNLVFTLTDEEYKIAVRAIEEMEYFLKSPMIKDKEFRVKLFEMIKQTIRIRNCSTSSPQDRSGFVSDEGIVINQGNSVSQWSATTIPTQFNSGPLTAGSTIYMTSSGGVSMRINNEIIEQEDRQALRSIEDSMNVDPAAEEPFLNRILEEDDSWEFVEDDNDEDIPF